MTQIYFKITKCFSLTRENYFKLFLKFSNPADPTIKKRYPLLKEQISMIRFNLNYNICDGQEVELQFQDIFIIT